MKSSFSHFRITLQRVVGTEHFANLSKLAVKIISMYKILLPSSVKEFAVVMVIFLEKNDYYIGNGLLSQVSTLSKHFQRNKLGLL